MHSGGFHAPVHTGFHAPNHNGFNHGFHQNFHHGFNRSFFSFYPGFYGYGLGYYPYNNYYPYYSGSGYTYAPSYYYTYPDYYNNLGTSDDSYLETPVPYTSNSYSPPADIKQNTAPADTKAHVRLIVPADAVVWFDGDKTSQAGTAREFVSPPLTPGMEYAYEVRVRWMENGQPVDQTRTITVRAGSATAVDFTRLPPAR
jgi:uncharacterized protein (TIGR03000 family)